MSNDYKEYSTWWMRPAQGVAGTEEKIEVTVLATDPPHAFAKLMGNSLYNMSLMTSFGDEIFTVDAYQLLIWTEREIDNEN